MIEKRLVALNLNHDDPAQPKHQRLSKHLIAEMLAGRLRPGEGLPSENCLVATLGVARTTVRHAMASLEKDGLIRRVPGKGTFVDADVRRKLRRGQDIYALVVPETRAGFYPSLLYGFDAAARGVHHQALVCNTDNDIARQAEIVLQLIDKKVGGVAINPATLPPTPAYQIRQLQEHGIPVVFCHRRIDGIAAPLLAISFHGVGHLAGKALAEHGHQRVAFITAQRSPATLKYEEGLQDGLRSGGSDVPPEAVFLGESAYFREEDVWNALQRLFGSPDPPTAIFASYDPLAEMIYLLLPRLGLCVPEDVSLIGEGSTWREGALIRRLTSVVIDEVATGQKAVSLLHEMRCGVRAIDDNEEFMLELNLCKGETLAVPAATTRRTVTLTTGR